jgi:replicative DNA helicase
MENQELKSIPYAQDMEDSVLAACLVRTDDTLPLVLDELSSEDFYTSKNQCIFRTIKQLRFFKEPVELITLARKLTDNGDLAMAGGMEGLSRLVDTVPVSTDISFHIKNLKEKRALREAIAGCTNILNKAYDTKDPEALIAEMHQTLLPIEITADSKDLQDMHALIEDQSDRVEFLRQHRGSLVGPTFGWHGVDHHTNGCRAGNLNILAARPSMGKTAMAINMARLQLLRGIPIGIFSLEMPAGDLMDRMVCDDLGLDTMLFSKGNFSDNDLRTIVLAQQKLWELPLWIHDSGSLTVEQICSISRKEHRKNPVKVIYVDHLQLVRSKQRHNTRNDELGYITGSLKSLAKELKCTVICLSQLNRQLEQRPNPHKQPRLSDLRDSGNIEQDADIIFFIYRPGEYHDQDTEEWPGMSLLNIAKNRNGPTGSVKLTWEKESARFRESDTVYGDTQTPLS